MELFWELLTTLRKKSSTTDACQGLEYAYNGKYDDV